MTTPTVGPQPVVVNLRITQTNTLRARFIYEAGGVPQPLTGWQATLSVSKRRGGPQVFVCTVGDGVTMEPDSTTGAIDVFVSTARTSLLKRNGAYDLTINNATTGESVRLFEGEVVLDKAAVKVA